MATLRTTWERALLAMAHEHPPAVALALREHAKRGVDCPRAFAYVLAAELNIHPRDPALLERVALLVGEEAARVKPEVERMVQLFEEAAGWDRPAPPSGSWEKIQHGTNENDGATWCGQGLGHEVMPGMDSGSFLGSAGWIVWTRRPALVTCVSCRANKLDEIRMRFARGCVAEESGPTYVPRLG